MGTIGDLSATLSRARGERGTRRVVARDAWRCGRVRMRARGWIDRSRVVDARRSVGWSVGGGTIARARGTRRRATDWLYVRYPRRRTRPRRLDVRVDRRR